MATILLITPTGWALLATGLCSPVGRNRQGARAAIASGVFFNIVILFGRLNNMTRFQLLYTLLFFNS